MTGGTRHDPKRTSRRGETMLAIFLVLMMSLAGAAPAAETALSWEIVSSNDTGLVIDIRVPEISIIQAGGFSRVDCPGASVMQRAGAPALPLLGKLVAVPAGSNPRIEAIETSDVRMIDVPARVAPFSPDVSKLLSPGMSACPADEKIYGVNEFYPSTRGKIRECVVFRGLTMAALELYPANYNPAAGTILYPASMRVRISFDNADMQASAASAARAANTPFSGVMDEFCLNHRAFLEPSAGDGAWPNPVPMVYLVISADEFLSQAGAFAEWKTLKGFETVVVPMSQIGSTADDIILFVTDAYENWPSPPSYLLLFGDTNTIPGDKGDTSLWGILKHKTDLHYACVDGADYIPDIAYGRFPVRTSAEAWGMVETAVSYERYDLASTEWLDTAVFIGGEDSSYWQVAEATHRYVIANHIIPAGMDYTAIRGHFGGSTSDITEAVNAGAMLVNYSGHGSTTTWVEPAYSQNNVRNLVNVGEHPFVISNACDTGKYDNTECFAETWVRQGDAGGISFYGASNSTMWDGDDILERRMFDVVFDTPYTTAGEMTIGGQLFLYGSGYGRSHYYFEVYNLMGDPSIDLWFGVPDAMTVAHPVSFSPGWQEITVVVDAGGAPVDGALVCLYRDEDIFETGKSVAGEVSFSFDAWSGGSISLTVTGSGLIPYEGEIAEE